MKCLLCNTENQSKGDISQDIIEYYKNDISLMPNGVDVSNELNQEVHLYHCSNCDLKYYDYDPNKYDLKNFYDELRNKKDDNDNPWYDKPEKDEFDYVAGIIPSNYSVLEIGCGQGYFQKKLKNNDYYGIDKYTKQNGDIFDHVKTGNKYNVVCGFQVLEHVQNTREFIQACLECLKPGGLLIFSVPSESGFLGHIEGWALNYPPHHITRFSDLCLERIAKEFNLSLDDKKLYHEDMNPKHKEWLDGYHYKIEPGYDYTQSYGHTVIAVYKKI